MLFKQHVIWNFWYLSAMWVWRGQGLAFELSDDWQVDYASYAWHKLDSKVCSHLPHCKFVGNYVCLISSGAEPDSLFMDPDPGIFFQSGSRPHKKMFKGNNKILGEFFVQPKKYVFYF